MLTPEIAVIVAGFFAFAGQLIAAIVQSRKVTKIDHTTERIEVQTDSRLTEALAKVDYLTEKLAAAKVISIADRVTQLENLKKVNGAG
jgi:monoamine oxidase